MESYQVSSADLYNFVDQMGLLNVVWPGRDFISQSMFSSDNEVPGDVQCKLYEAEYFYHDLYVSYLSYYGYYTGYWHDACAHSSVNSGMEWSGGWRSLWLLSAVWFVGFSSILIGLHANVISDYLIGAARTLSNPIHRLWTGFWSAFSADIHDVRQAFLFFLCEVLLVLARRVPAGKGKLRKVAMRIDEVVEPATPARSSSSDATSSRRRTLRQIQMAQGGIRCRLMGRVRISCVHKRKVQILYNPVGRGDCCFAALRHGLGSSESSRHIRTMLKQHAKLLLATDEPFLQGKTLREHLQGLQLDAETFVAALDDSRRRWGNTLDIAVASHLWQRSIQLFNMEKSCKVPILDCPGRGPPVQIGYYKSHFVVLRVRARIPPKS
eukprot:6480274-Amphidinium_carterae.4